jgi:GGDEF domain-containing protein
MQLALNINQAKILFSAMVGTALSLIAYLDFLSANYVAFLITATVSILLFINGLYLALRKQKHQPNYIIWLYMALLAAFSLVISSQDQGQNIYWIYFYSISAMFLFPMKQALFLFFSYIPLALYIIFNFAPALEQPQVLFTFATIGTVAIFLAVVKSRTNKLLEPLISKELDTGAQKEKFLRLALRTEITRAEREGTGLTLMYFQLEPNYKAIKHSRLNFLQQVANAISATLRPFDQYYRVQQYGFAVILPHTTTKEAVTKAQGILSSIGHSEHDKNIQLGLSSLNVGDTSDTLIFAAKQALKYV